MATPFSTGWSASRLAPRTGLGGFSLTGAANQQNSLFSAVRNALGIKAPAPALATPAPLATVGAASPTAATSTQLSGLPQFSQSGFAPDRTPQAALQAALMRAIGIPGQAISGDAPGAPLAILPAANVSIPGVTNVNTLASQSQNLPPWLQNAMANLGNPDNFAPAAPAMMGGGFDPLIGQTLAATEARIAAQQKALAEENKARIARVKADAAAAERAQQANLERMRFTSPTFGGYGTGWTYPSII